MVGQLSRKLYRFHCEADLGGPHWLWCNSGGELGDGDLASSLDLAGQHSIPDHRRRLSIEPPAQGKLVLVDTAEKFNARDRDSGRCKALKT